MAKKKKKKTFRDTQEVFLEYIPDYTPPCLRQSKAEANEKIYCNSFTEDLLVAFKKKVAL